MTNIYSSKIAATGSCFPKKIVTNFDLSKTIDTSDEWISERTGIRERRISDVNHGEANSDLGYKAALIALKRAGIKNQDLDLILYATVSPDYIMPNTACILQERLGANNAAALDISAACSGFIYGLSIADAFIRSGQYTNILLIGGEVLSPMVDWTERGTSILFGDGAGAAIVTRAQKNEKSKILSTHLHADGSLKELFFLPGGGSKTPLTHEALDQKLNYMQMKGREIFKVAVKMLSDCAIESLKANHLTLDDVDWIVPHQANLRILEAVAKRLDISMDKFITNLQEYGNTSSATVPTALDQAIESGKIKKGDLILMTVFGAGITYGSALVRW